MRKSRKDKKGATLIELVITMVLLAIIGATLFGVIIFFVQLFMYSPRQLDTQKIGQELENIMIEGNQDIRGLRWTRVVLDASAAQFSYIYGYPTISDGQAVRLRWNAADKKIYRSTSSNGGGSWSAETIIPVYLLNNSSISIDGKDTSGVIFTYKKAGDIAWVSGTDALTDIRAVIISINVKTGAGSFANFQGSSNITASAEIKSL